MNLSTLIDSVELSKSLWAFGDIVGPRSVCESSVSLWDLVSLWACNVSAESSAVEPSASVGSQRACGFSAIYGVSSESVGPLTLLTLVVLWALSESVGLQ